MRIADLATLLATALLTVAHTHSHATTVPMIAGAPASNDAVFFDKFYAGKIADQYAFTMELKNFNGKLTGTYQYAGRPAELSLQGSIDAAGAFAMDELSNTGKRTGVFKGALAGKQIAGVWHSADGTKKWNFSADQTSEIQIGSKKDILTHAVGVYALDTISGSGGANGMWDTWKDKGKWGSNFSAISGGMREGHTVKLTAADTHLLNSIMVTVDSDLTTRLLARGKALLSVPFRDNGMQLNIKTAHNGDAEEDLKRLSSGTTVLGEKLYLLAQDGVNFSSEMSGHFEATLSDIVVVSYSIIEDMFSVSFSEGQCCGSSVFTFKRSHH